MNDIQNEKKDESTYKQSQLGFSSHAFRKVLGLNWDTNNDFLVYKFGDIIAVASKLEITKRNIPRVLAMFYDPLGLICSIVLQFRLIFQSLCAEKLEWNSPLPLHHSVQLKKLLNNLTKLRTVSVKRYLLLNPANDTDTVELHGLCDSSMEAYGVAMYIREISKSKQVHTTLYSAKCRLVPSKGLLSIPRLELLSCLLLSEQMKAVFDAISIQITINEVFCWSDSLIAFWWIKQVQKSWKISVENRAEKIRSNVPIDSWRCIRADQNPADIATRRVTPCVLLGNFLWWEDPSLLKIEDSV